jgi:hypothetical protein
MSYENIPGRQVYGEHIESALARNPLCVEEAVQGLRRTPDPIPANYKSILEDITGLAVLAWADSPDIEANREAFMQGINCGYMLAAVTAVVTPPKLAYDRLHSRSDKTSAMESVLQDAELWPLRNNMMGSIADEASKQLDPAGEYPTLIRNGILTGLYMADIGLCNMLLEDADRRIVSIAFYLLKMSEKEFYREIDEEVDSLISDTPPDGYQE